MKRVLLTGATGFLGRACIPPLIRHGYEIHGVYYHSNVASKIGDNVIWHQANLLDSAAVRQLVTEAKPSDLLHLAWDVNPKTYWNSPENFRWVQGTIALWEEFASQGGKRLVSTGSCAEYSWDTGICSEGETPIQPSSAYGNCKAALSLLSSALHILSGQSAAWARLFYMFGPYENTERLVPSVINNLLANKAALCSTGDQFRDYLYIEDAADALIALLDSSVEGAVNIASGSDIKINDLVRIIAGQLDRLSLVQFGAIPMPTNDPLRIAADVARLRDEVGWVPQQSIENAIAKTINWWQEQLTLRGLNG